jgi:hypothetical protein
MEASLLERISVELEMVDSIYSEDGVISEPVREVNTAEDGE